MRTIYLSNVFFLCALNMVFSQIKTPRVSPMSKSEQMIGLTKVELFYSRPSMRGRQIFGALVPYEKIWRTGANENTVISFGSDVIFGGVAIKSGRYALYTIPGKYKWKVILYDTTDNWGTPEVFDASRVVTEVLIEIIKLPQVQESFTISFSDLSNEGANLCFTWERTRVKVPIIVPTEKKVLSSMKTTKSKSAEDYFKVAGYFFEVNKKLDKAKNWIDKAVETTSDKPKFWYLRLQSLIYASIGEKKKAIRIAKKSLKLAKESGNQDYIIMNKNSIEKWKKQ